ncbi:hypothetical protein K0M31_014885 [Melipona bicolor]|uniref:Uncharacterized protein n=1 Tax=Melipona bicolor TaxID=60889 RepID=A0AA40FGN7_9HYME|nr:hypothetical protein K0M31_014885 [Melipona bicolor]
MTRSRNSGCRWCGGSGGGGSGDGGGWSRYGGSFHRKSSCPVAAFPPRPLQSADQGVSEIFREHAVDVERDRVIDYL